jgi:hypothetical protein
MSGAGFVRPGLRCEKCGLPFALSLVADVFSERDLKKLSDPFEARCPMCKHQATYPKSSILPLMDTGPR